MTAIRAIAVALMLAVSITATAQTPNDRIVNAYFANDAVRVDGWLQPERVIRQLKGNHPATSAVFVLNLHLSKGHHRMVARVDGPDGNEFTTIPFTDEVVAEGSDVRAIWGVLRGRLPTGGITVTVIHSRDGGSANELGVFYLPTTP